MFHVSVLTFCCCFYVLLRGTTNRRQTLLPVLLTHLSCLVGFLPLLVGTIIVQTLCLSSEQRKCRHSERRLENIPAQATPLPFSVPFSLRHCSVVVSAEELWLFFYAVCRHVCLSICVTVFVCVVLFISASFCRSH